MTVEIEPNGDRYDHVFDEMGRLLSVEDLEGGRWGHSRSSSEDGTTVATRVSASGESTTHSDVLTASDEYVSTITSPDGGVTYFSRDRSSLRTTKLPLGRYPYPIRDSPWSPVESTPNRAGRWSRFGVLADFPVRAGADGHRLLGVR